MSSLEISLAKIAKRINEREENIQALKSRAVGAVNESLCEALFQGQDLLELKAKVAHGNWQNWLRANCPKLSLRTAQRYMALAAKAPEIGSLQEADSLRAALALCELEGAKQGQSPKQWPAYIEATSRLNKLAGYLERNPLDAWPSEGIDKFRAELQPIAERLWPDKFQ